MDDERWLERVAAATSPEADVPARAPARLKAQIYSAVVERMAQAGPLLTLQATKATGSRLCVFEAALAALPVGDRVGSMNPCRVCHARVLAERLDDAPIFWPGCPYAEFHRQFRR
jgi:hypothetical protein